MVPMLPLKAHTTIGFSDMFVKGKILKASNFSAGSGLKGSFSFFLLA